MNKDLVEIDKLFRSKKFDEVISRTKNLIKKGFTIPPYYNLLGISLDNVGKHEKAEKIFLDAIKKMPNEASFYSNLGKILINQNKLEKAEKFLIKGLDVNRNDTFILFEIGKIKRLQKKPKEGLNYFEQVFKINPKFPNALFMIAKSYLEISQESEDKKYKDLSVKTLLDCSKSEPENVDSDFLLSEIIDYSSSKAHQKVMLNKMNNLVLVRHGQSKFNLERRFTGFYDVELTPRGEAEANYAGELIKKLNIEFDEYFTSQLVRASNSLNIILKVLQKPNAKVIKAWELNERHYGGLTGLNKDETIKKYGDKQVKIWRRSFDISPPKMEPDHPYKDKINSNILGESLKNTFERVVPYYVKKIKPLILSNKNILIVFHGNSCRALLMEILNISKKKIVEFEIPTGNPLLIRFEKNLKVKDCKYLDEQRAKKILFNI